MNFDKIFGKTKKSGKGMIDMSLSKNFGIKGMSVMMGNSKNLNNMMGNSKNLNNMMGNSKNGASMKMQSMWANMSTPQRASMRRTHIDSDGDGVPNKWDCQPYNRMKQDTSLNIEMKKIVDSLPIFILEKTYQFNSRDKSLNFQEKIKNTSSLKKFINSSLRFNSGTYSGNNIQNPLVKDFIYSIFKKYPNLINDIKNINVKILFIPTTYNSMSYISPTSEPIIKNNIVISSFITIPFPIDEFIDNELRERMASSLFHELKHSSQTINKSKNDKSVNPQYYDNPSEYNKDIYEKEAVKYQYDKLIERYPNNIESIEKKRKWAMETKKLLGELRGGKITRDIYENELDTKHEEIFG